MSYISLGLDSSSALAKSGLKEVPSTRAVNCRKVKMLWNDSKCKTMLDYLRIYNMSDVQPPEVFL